MINQKKIETELEKYYENSEDYLKILNSGKILKPYLDMIKKFLPNKEIKVLEVGCGSGISTRFIKKIKPNINLVATDISKKFIECAKKNYKDKKVIFKQENAVNLTFKDNSFDFIIMYNVIEHIPYPKKALEETIRVLKKKGVIIIMSPNHISPITPLIDFIRFRARPPFTKSWIGNISLFFKNLYTSIKKIVNKKAEFILVEPVLNDSIQVGGDSDATYKSCQIDLVKFFKKKSFEILNIAYSGKGLSGILGKIFPLFVGGFCIVAKKSD